MMVACKVTEAQEELQRRVYLIERVNPKILGGIVENFVIIVMINQ